MYLSADIPELVFTIGISLWYGDADKEATEGTVSGGKVEIMTFTIAIMNCLPDTNICHHRYIPFAVVTIS
jgi:hypothetical protein